MQSPLLIIGLISKYFTKNLNWRLSGALLSACIFFVITNFGVWASGMYGHTINGLISAYVLAIPFFTYSLISTIVFSLLIETVYKFYKIKFVKV